MENLDKNIYITVIFKKKRITALKQSSTKSMLKPQIVVLYELNMWDTTCIICEL